MNCWKKTKILFLLTIWCGLYAQLVQKAAPPAKVPSKSSPKVEKGIPSQVKISDILKKNGLTERVIIEAKKLSSVGNCVFLLGSLVYEANPSIKGISGGAKGDVIFNIFVANYWAGTAPSITEFGDGSRYVLKVGNGVSISQDRGNSWIVGEKGEFGWVFADQSSMVKINCSSSRFEPSVFESFAFSGAKVFASKVDNPGSWRISGSAPVVFDGVVSIARNDVEAVAIFKPAMHNWHIFMRGVKFNNEWIFSSTEKRLFSAGYIFSENGTAQGVNFGKPTNINMVMNDKNVYLFSEKSGSIEWASLRDGLSHIAANGIVIDMNNTIKLDNLNLQFKEKWNSPVWFATDDPESFDSVSDRLFVENGLVAHVPEKTRNPNGEVGFIDRILSRCLEYKVNRGRVVINEAGQFRFVDDVLQGGNKELSRSSNRRSQSDMETALSGLTLGNINKDGKSLVVFSPFKNKVVYGDLESADQPVEVDVKDKFLIIEPLPFPGGFICLREDGLRQIDNDGKLVRTFSAEGMVTINWFGFSQENDVLFGIGTDGKVRIWKTSNGILQQVIFEKPSVFDNVSFGKNPNYVNVNKKYTVDAAAISKNKIFLGMGDGAVTIFDVESGKKIKRIDDVGKSKTLSFHLLLDGKMLVVVGSKGELSYISTDSWKVVKRVQAGVGTLMKAALGKGKNSLLLGWRSGRVSEIDLESGSTVGEYDLSDSMIVAVGYLQGGGCVAVDVKGVVWKKKDDGFLKLEAWSRSGESSKKK